MVVTDIEKIDKKRYRIYAEGQPVFVLYKGEILRYGIRIQEEITLETYEEIKKTVLQKRAKLRCMNLLKSMDRTEYQLRTRLRQGEYPKEVIEEAIAYVKSYRYIDDERYARQYIEYKKDRKSRRQITQELLLKGIEKGLIQQVMEELEPVCEEQVIRRLIEKKKVDLNNASTAELHKLYLFLQRKGFSVSEISKVIRNVNYFDSI